MRRFTAAAAICLLALGFAAPVSAAKPVGGCPNDTFERMTFAQFIELSLSVGVPPENVDAIAAGLAVIDANDDGTLCVLDLPDTPGHGGGVLFNVVDNVSHS